MQPFIGLTAKVTIIQDVALLNTIGHEQSRPSKYSSAIDAKLYQHLSDNELFTQRRPWLPMPLLGIPNWAHVPQTPAFYADKSYFMSKAAKRNN